jgi:DNA-binding IclR family transcriptional regulator
MNNINKKTQPISSAVKVLAVLNVLFRNFAYGFSNKELATQTGIPASDITRYVNTLELAGFAERIPETGRIRVSHRTAQMAVQVMRALDEAEARATESKNRILKG